MNYQGNKRKFYGFHAIGLNIIIIKSQSKVLVEIWNQIIRSWCVAFGFSIVILKDSKRWKKIANSFVLELDIFINSQNLFQSTFLIFDTVIAYRILLLGYKFFEGSSFSDIKNNPN